MTTTVKGVITEQLRDLGVNKPNLMAIAEHLATLDTKDVIGRRVSAGGTGAIDQITVSSLVRATYLEEFLKKLRDQHLLRAIHTFPWGVPRPEIYEVHATFGNAASQREI